MHKITVTGTSVRLTGPAEILPRAESKGRLAPPRVFFFAILAVKL